MERAMSEVEFDRIIDAVRKEIALGQVERSLVALRTAGEGSKTGESRPARRQVHGIPIARVRRIGERQKRYR
jgi:hypothetical protein